MNNDASLPPEPRATSTTRSDTVLDWARDAGAGELLAGGLDRYLQRRRRRRRAFVATACAVLLIMSVVWLPFREATPIEAVAIDDPSATILRPERRMLPDGSAIDLNSGAEVEVQFNATVRRIVLRQGEAHFQVTKDARRPFLVAAGGIEVRAVGTAFAVDLGVAAVDVLVTEGRVDVSATQNAAATSIASAPSSAPLPPLAALGAGGRFVIDHKTPSAGTTGPRISELSPADINTRLAWRVPRLKFAATPLVQVVAMFNEHARPGRDARLVLAAEVPTDIRVSGTLRADDVDSLLRLLKGEFGISGETRAGEIVLRRQ